MKRNAVFLFIVGFLFLPGFTLEEGTVTVSSTINLQPEDERNAQETLPKARDALWDTLSKTAITVDEKAGTYAATFPDEVRKMNGHDIRIDGFMLPLETTETFSHFLLSKRTPTCFFCPPGAPNEIIEVYATRPVEWTEELVTYEGRFELIDNREMGVFFKLTGAIRK